MTPQDHRLRRHLFGLVLAKLLALALLGWHLAGQRAPLDAGRVGPAAAAAARPVEIHESTQP